MIRRLSILGATVLALVWTATRADTAASPQSVTAAAPAAPRLIVLIVVDQFRGDYVQLYGRQWTGGLNEIFSRGAYFPAAAYPYGGTKTCAGHASVSTGTLPAVHGMIDNEWYDAAAHTFTTCTADPSARSIGYAGEGQEHHSARLLRAETLSDALVRASPRSRVVSLAVKPRSAIALGGHGGPTVTTVWNEESTGQWATSTAYTAAPDPVLSAFIAAHPIAGAKGAEWTRILPESAYAGPDDGRGEPAPSRFPHWLDDPIRTAPTSATFTTVWEQSPWPDAYLADLAVLALDRMKLGQQAQTDMLAIGFSSLDAVGHRFGPRSHEIQDVLARLDRILDRLIKQLDGAIGRDRYMLALTADHGVAEMPEQLQPPDSGGRVTTAAIAAAAEGALETLFGRGQYVEAVSGSCIYFRAGVAERIRSSAVARNAVERSLLSARGVARVFWADALADAAPTPDDMLAMMRRSHVTGRSGDLTFVLKPNWMTVSTGTTHGSPYLFDRQVPLAFLGAGVAAGRYPAMATPLDIVPTLAARARLAMPRMHGQVLTEVVRAR
jgi:predicted AlkP superfamily pyrophosphatase or phosphodiesterase